MALAGVVSVELDVDGDDGVGRVVDVADELLCDDGDIAVRLVGGAGDFPPHFGGVLGHAAVDLAVEDLDDLGAALVPPHLCGRDLLAVVAG